MIHCLPIMRTALSSQAGTKASCGRVHQLVFAWLMIGAGLMATACGTDPHGEAAAARVRERGPRVAVLPVRNFSGTDLRHLPERLIRSREIAQLLAGERPPQTFDGQDSLTVAWAIELERLGLQPASAPTPAEWAGGSGVDIDMPRLRATTREATRCEIGFTLVVSQCDWVELFATSRLRLAATLVAEDLSTGKLMWRADTGPLLVEIPTDRLTALGLDLNAEWPRLQAILLDRLLHDFSSHSN